MYAFLISVILKSIKITKLVLYFSVFSITYFILHAVVFLSRVLRIPSKFSNFFIKYFLKYEIFRNNYNNYLNFRDDEMFYNYMLENDFFFKFRSPRFGEVIINEISTYSYDLYLEMKKEQTPQESEIFFYMLFNYFRDVYLKIYKQEIPEEGGFFQYMLFNKNGKYCYPWVKTHLYYKFIIKNSWDFYRLTVDSFFKIGFTLIKPSVENYYYINNYIHGFILRKQYTQFNNNFFFNNYIKKDKFHFLKFSFYIYSFLKNFIIPTFLSLSFFFYSFFFFKLSFFKTLGNWFLFILLFFWFFSTFNFFIKRYRYSKYTSALQRFWKRAFMSFWIIEGFLFSLFFYYLLNASGEPSFMFDTFGFFVDHLLPIKPFLLNSFLVVIIINVIVFLLINIKTHSYKKNVPFLLLSTIVLLYILFTESYQFYYILNFYIEYIWFFSEEDNVWELDYDIPRTRNKNHYITLIILAKFWHFIFVFICWIFFIMKTNETQRLRYSFLSMNLQNLILFYIMSWLCLYSWFKWIFRRFMDQTYYWFFTSFRPLTISFIFKDIYSLFKNFLNFNILSFKSVYKINFYYLSNSFYIYGQSTYFKKYILNSFFY